MEIKDTLKQITTEQYYIEVCNRLFTYNPFLKNIRIKSLEDLCDHSEDILLYLLTESNNELKILMNVRAEWRSHGKDSVGGLWP